MDVSTLFAIAIGGLLVWNLSRAFMGKVAPDKARALVKEGARLVDVRSPGEHASGHIKGSLNVPVQELSARIAELGDKAKPVVVYCASGMRSASAAGMLRRAGFKDVHDLGAMARWGGG
jgi:phage shock protein E